MCNAPCRIQTDRVVDVGICKHTPNNMPPVWNDMNWELASRAVIACCKKGYGFVLFTAGPHIAYELYEMRCGNNLIDLDLEDAPIGISVWEGIIECKELVMEEYEADAICAVGTYRKPTNEEWSAIHEGRCPWDENLWVKQNH